MFIVLSLVIVALIIWSIFIYNGLIRLKNQVDEAWSDINVQLKRRYDLIPNLLETVKGYKEYESETFQKITQLRQQAMTAQSIEDKGKAETALTLGLSKLFAVAENYPELKANNSFLDLQKNLTDTENQIEKARRYYNGTTREYNIRIQSVPDNIFANLLHFTKRDFFALESDVEKQVPKVAF
ncbi:LemA family protein [Legionella maioricensis]|uniref:LemA family protein n=1 Tax=Legionella maioricensis TaxID=2896528 RepID=A0A9X2D1T8_9GAMM|nr:LemA family protein [Legionella maioricensis]MCL9684856.1 LemA family protein [Legionella maioricensis]MCL9688536.1 LemA family protein [Legionella maioricensis]